MRYRYSFFNFFIHLLYLSIKNNNKKAINNIIKNCKATPRIHIEDFDIYDYTVNDWIFVNLVPTNIDKIVKIINETTDIEKEEKIGLIKLLASSNYINDIHFDKIKSL